MRHDPKVSTQTEREVKPLRGLLLFFLIKRKAYRVAYFRKDNMYRVIFKNRFRSKPINLGRAVRVMYHQPFTGSIRIEHITWWK